MTEEEVEGSHVHLEEHILVFLTGRGLNLLGELDHGLKMRIVLLLLYKKYISEQRPHICVEWRNLLQAIDGLLVHVKRERN